MGNKGAQSFISRQQRIFFDLKLIEGNRVNLRNSEIAIFNKASKCIFSFVIAVENFRRTGNKVNVHSISVCFNLVSGNLNLAQKNRDHDNGVMII